MLTRPHARTHLLVVLVALAALGGCNKDRGPAESQVAARVNDGEVSIHQVQAVLQRQPRLIAATGNAAAAKVLDVLVEQELAAQAARTQGLDKDPGVVQTLEVVRREALARAYQERVAAAVPQPTSDEVDRYYDSRPELFAARRLYVLQEAAVEVAEAQLPALDKVVATARDVDALTAALRDAGLRHSTRMTAAAAEDLPLGVVGPLAKLEGGQSVLLRQPAGARIYTVVHATRAPIDRRTAQEAIVNYLTGERKRQAIADAQRALRDKAKIAYGGPFATREAAPAVTDAASAPK